MPNLINKVKLIEALKARKQRIIEDHEKKVKEYEKAIEKFRQATVRNLMKLVNEVKLAKTVGDILDAIESVQVFGRSNKRPQKPFNKAPVATINKILIELELLGDDVVTIESSKNYLAVLSGQYDGYEREYNDDSDCDSDEED